MARISKRLLLFFTRLRAAGNYNSKCTIAKGRCSGRYTKISANALKKTEFVNTNKKSPNYQKMLDVARSRAGGDRDLARKVLTEAKGTGNRIFNKVSLSKRGAQNKTRVRKKGQDIRKQTTRTPEQIAAKREKERLKAALYRRKYMKK